MKAHSRGILFTKAVSEKDKASLDTFYSLMEEREEVVWVGKPMYKFQITSFEIAGDMALSLGSLLLVILIVSVFFGYEAYQAGNYWTMILLFLFGIGTFILPEIRNEIKRRNMLYVVTTNSIFFKQWKMGQKVIHKLKFDEIADIRYVAFDDSPGVLYFMCKEKPTFTTYNLSTMDSRAHPTFEDIEHVQKQQQYFIQLLRDNNRGR